VSEREGSQRERGATPAAGTAPAPAGQPGERGLSEREGSQRERGLSEREGGPGEAQERTLPTLTVDVHTPDGGTDGTVELPAAVFDVQANVALMHQVVVGQLAAARQGTHDTKTRGETAGGGKKPYRQKGTGRARQGSIRAPQFTGGGTAHGPTPRSYEQRTPKKMKAAALRGALSDRARDGRVHVISSFVDGDTPSTKDALAALVAVADSRHLLVVADRSDGLTWKSLRNVPSVHLIAPGQLNTYDVLVSDDVVFTRDALDRLAGPAAGGGTGAAKPDLTTPDIPGEPVPSVAPAAGEGSVDTEEGEQ
jgi:large subunit ribosomal protein L4